MNENFREGFEKQAGIARKVIKRARKLKAQKFDNAGHRETFDLLKRESSFYKIKQPKLKASDYVDQSQVRLPKRKGFTDAQHAADAKRHGFKKGPDGDFYKKRNKR